MHPHGHPLPSTLHRPPARAPRRERRGVMALVAVCWGLTGMTLGPILYGVGALAVMGAAEGLPVGGYLVRTLGPVVVWAAVLTALAFAPGVRRLARETGLLLTGVLAVPAPPVLACRLPLGFR